MKTNKKAWFVKTRGSYLPKTWQGGLLYLLYLVYLVWALVFVLKGDYEFWNGLFFIVPNWIAACVIFSWLASQKSAK